MSLPSPKEVLKQAADLLDAIAEPARSLVESLGLPTPPKAAEVVESLPEPPELPGLPGLPQPKKEKVEELEEVEKIGLEELELPGEEVEFKEV